MPTRLPAFAVAALLWGAAFLLPAAAAGRDACADTARRAPADTRILRAIDEARRQHQLFGGQTIERDGGLFHVGHHEAEWSHGRDDAMPAWQRVAGFWRAVSETDPPRLMTSAGWVARAEVPGAGESPRVETAVQEALLRAAIVDTPWSAAFISYLMKGAGFAPEEFAFSDSHVDYVQAAFAASAAEAQGQPASHAFRACDVATTPPRAGDLLCATRADTVGIARFKALAAALSVRRPGESFPMHCDLVVRADAGGDAKLETIGGNVVQSVTLTRMTLNARKVLGAGYIDSGAHAGCGGRSCRGHLGRRPWVVLLQFRP